MRGGFRKCQFLRYVINEHSLKGLLRLFLNKFNKYHFFRCRCKENYLEYRECQEFLDLEKRLGVNVDNGVDLEKYLEQKRLLEEKEEAVLALEDKLVTAP